MKIRRMGAVLGLALGLLTFVAFAGVAAAADPVMVQLSAQNNSGITGTAVLTDMGNNQTQVVINVTGFQAGVASPIHIHEGTCANLTPTPKYPLTNLVDGKSTTMVPVALSALVAQPYAVNAHKSTQEASVYVACGNIPAQAAATGQAPSAAPRTGGGGMSRGVSPLPWIAVAALLAITVAGASFALRRRQA